jgi:hypothetical protein
MWAINEKRFINSSLVMELSSVVGIEIASALCGMHGNIPAKTVSDETRYASRPGTGWDYPMTH